MIVERAEHADQQLSAAARPVKMLWCAVRSKDTRQAADSRGYPSWLSASTDSPIQRAAKKQSSPPGGADSAELAPLHAHDGAEADAVAKARSAAQWLTGAVVMRGSPCSR